MLDINVGNPGFKFTSVFFNGKFGAAINHYIVGRVLDFSSANLHKNGNHE